jgi:hypothetical protein
MGISSRDKILNTIKRGIYRPGDEKTDAPESIFHKLIYITTDEKRKLLGTWYRKREPH